jgi:hypothetical protein
MNPAAKIIATLGGTRRAAALLDLPPSTVQSWKAVGLIPARHQRRVLDAARSNGIALGPEDFFPPAQSVPVPEGAAA